MRYRKLKDETRNFHLKNPQQTPNRRCATVAAFFTSRRCRIIACIFFALMLLLGAIPGEAKALSDAFGDKLLHLCAYSFLTCLLFAGVNGTIAGRAWQTIMLIGLLGGIDEAIQSFMPYRNANLSDWIVDMLAAGLALTVLIALNNRRRMYRAPSHRTVRPAESPN
jgi:hypothetical protein